MKKIQMVLACLYVSLDGEDFMVHINDKQAIDDNGDDDD